jgi:hypothetical protein
VLDDRETEAGAARGARSVGSVERSKSREARLLDAYPVVPSDELNHTVRLTLDIERERRTRARIANRILRQVAGDDAQHPGADSELDLRVALQFESNACALRALTELVEGLLEDRPDRLSAERDDPRPDSSSLRKSTSSISSVIWFTSAMACSSTADTSSPGSAAVSRIVSSRASGVRSSCDTAAVNPERSSS